MNTWEALCVTFRELRVLSERVSEYIALNFPSDV